MPEAIPRTSPLPSEPNLRHLRDQAKDLLRSGAAPSLSAALFQIAKLYEFPSWPSLKKHVEDQTNAGKLKQAIDRDDVAEVRRLLVRHPELRKAPIGYGGDGPLTWAAECRGVGRPSQERLDIVEWLISTGSDIHEGGDAPLMRASLDGSRTSMMDLLVRYGADVNAVWHGSYPIIFAPVKPLMRLLSPGFCVVELIQTAAMRLPGTPRGFPTREQRSTICLEHTFETRRL